MKSQFFVHRQLISKRLKKLFKNWAVLEYERLHFCNSGRLFLAKTLKRIRKEDWFKARYSYDTTI